LTIDVQGAASDSDAQQLARAIANSPLVKTALAGADPNWGRILSSAGASGIRFDPAKVDIRLNGHLVCRRGRRANFSENKVQASMEANECTLHFRIGGSAKGKARFWTCDMTETYIRINAEYRT
jgi:glutamate N-acetyltransferase/amino-acid N-acetyltransferase